MNNRLLVSVAAIALIGGVGAVNAQGGMNREGGAATQKGTEQSYGQKSTQSEPKTSGAAKGQRAEDNARGEKSKNLSTENARDQNQKSKNLSTENGTKSSAKAEGREGGNNSMKAEGRNNNLNAEGREVRGNERSQVTTGQAGGGAKLSTEQRSRITTVIRNEHVAPINNADFAISVGARVPRERISLRPLPSEVVTIYPEWRGYEFFLVRDEIIVVDPRTLEIVAVLPA